LDFFKVPYEAVIPKDPYIDKTYASASIDSVLFRTRFSNFYNQQFTAHLIYANLDSTQIDSLTLYDDGMLGDSLSNDGLYGAYIPPTQTEDFYSLSLSTINHQNNYYINLSDVWRFTTVPLLMDSLQAGTASNFRYIFKPFLKNASIAHTIKNIVVNITCNDPWVTSIPFTWRACPNLVPGQIAGVSQPFAVSYDSAKFPGYFNLKFSISSYGWSYWEIDTTIIVKPVDVEEEMSLPLAYKLEQNFPNPWNPTTTVGFGIMEKGNVRLSVLNILGEEIRVLINEEKEAGYHAMDFNGSDLPSGVYFYRIQAGNFIDTKKMILLK
jgi:hypothetical protein